MMLYFVVRSGYVVLLHALTSIQFRTRGTAHEG